MSLVDVLKEAYLGIGIHAKRQEEHTSVLESKHIPFINEQRTYIGGFERAQKILGVAAPTAMHAISAYLLFKDQPIVTPIFISGTAEILRWTVYAFAQLGWLGKKDETSNDTNT